MSLAAAACASSKPDSSLDIDASFASIDLGDGGVAPLHASPPAKAASADLGSLRELPVLHGTHYHAATSTDRGGRTFDGIPVGNKDFNNFVAVCERATLPAQTVDLPSACDDGIAGYVLAREDEGPGVVSRIFLTGLSWTNERIRIYTDDLVTPQINMLVADWYAGSHSPFAPPLTQWTSGALVDYVPIAYESRLRVVLDDVDASAFVYYHVDRIRLPHGSAEPTADPSALEATLQDAVAPRASDVHSALSLAPGESRSIVAADGGGTFERLELRVEPPSALATLRLEAYWDGRSDAAISMPLASLFGCFQELASFETAPMAVHVEDGAVALRLSLPMPYRRGARIALENTGTDLARVTVDLGLGPAPSVARFGRLHALAHERRPPLPSDERYEVAALRGRGKYVGTLVRFAGGADAEHDWPYDFSFLEGDEHVTIDGQTSVQGTGTEDYFNGGWYFEDGTYATPFSALIALASDAPATGHASMVRWHIGYDAIEFQTSLDFDFEYGNDDPITASDYQSVAFYYLE